MLKISESFDKSLHEKTVFEILKYARFIARRQLVCNTFGNIAIKQHIPSLNKEVIYTKHRGISLEEMEEENIVITDLNLDELILGTIRPSIGHQMHREIFKHRKDINAIIHLHPDYIISYFSILHDEGMQYISNDTALVMQKSIKILQPDINIEIDLEPIKYFIQETNCIIMPQHGITTLGETISEAYNRALSIVAETKRILFAYILSSLKNKAIPYVKDKEIQYMYKIGQELIYGK